MQKIFWLSLILFLSCTHKQNHDISPPVIPNYQLSGYLQEWVNGTPLQDYSVRVTANGQIYDVSFDTVFTFSDSIGKFTISPIYPGNYFLSVFREGMHLRTFHLVVEHNDLERTYKIPDILPVYQMKSNLQQFYSTPLAIDSATVWLFSEKIISLIPDGYGWMQDTIFDNPLVGLNITTVDLCDSVIYACNSPDSVILLNLKSKTVIDRKKINNANLMGIVCDRETGDFYGCSRTSLIKFNNTLDSITDIRTIEASAMQAMAWNHDLYIYDNQELVCYQYNLNFELINVFNLLDRNDNSQITNIFDMAFDNSGRLWVVPEN